MKRFFPLCVVFVLLLTGCGAEKPRQAQLFAMDTVMDFTVYGDQTGSATAAAEEEIRRLESLLSRTEADSEVSRINSGAGSAVAVSAETADLIRRAVSYSRLTGGAFDITVAPVVSAWGFTEESHRVPSDDTLSALLQAVGSDRIRLTGDSVTLEPEMAIDLGGIAKGYASDRAAAVLREQGVERAILSLGGNVCALGSKPDGSAWRVAVRDPAAPDGAVGILQLTDAFAVTSGGYQRYFEEDGKTYHHIIDPATGYPADSGLTSVTVVGTDGTLCDALSTALFVMGEEQAVSLWRQEGNFELVLVTDDGRVAVTEGLSHLFEANEDSGYVYETIS